MLTQEHGDLQEPRVEARLGKRIVEEAALAFRYHARVDAGLQHPPDCADVVVLDGKAKVLRKGLAVIAKVFIGVRLLERVLEELTLVIRPTGLRLLVVHDEEGLVVGLAHDGRFFLRAQRTSAAWRGTVAVKRSAN